ncbi:MAG: Smr/MutS family protein [SAR324 cluster bacterium]|nr:Smr/MutS family protein [SAR324 cluster bacterium]
MAAHEAHTSAAQSTPAALEWPRLWSALLERLATEQGREAAAVLNPFKRLSALRASLARIGEMCGLLEEQGPLDFSGAHPIAPLLDRVEKEGHLLAEELRRVLDTQQTAFRLAHLLEILPEAPGLSALPAACFPESDLVQALERALTPQGELDERAFPELGELRAEQGRKRGTILRKLEATLRKRGLGPAFQEQIYTLRGARYVLPVKADFRGQVPGIVHDVSASGATLFVEPHAVVEDSNALLMVEKQIEARIAQILGELSALVGGAAAGLRKNLLWLGQLDLLHAQALLAHDYQGSNPEVQEGGSIALKGAANPLMLLDGEQVVRNDFTLEDTAHCMVISGANTGGKTVLLKTVGLCAMLVRHGMPIPARPGSRCDLFTQVLADIGDRQSMSQSLSTFSAQIAFITEALPAAGPRSLVLIDEMLTGTAPQEGAVLAAILLEVLAAQGTRCVVTTHYSELKELAAAYPGMINASVAFDLDNLAPTYRLLVGTPGVSYAFPIAHRHGLDDALVAEARKRLAGRPATADALLAELHRQEERLREREETLQKQEEHLRAARGSLELREKGLSGREKEMRQRERGVIGKELEQARRRIAEVIKELQGANSLPLAGKVRKRLDEVTQQLLQNAEQPAPTSGSFKSEALQAGDAVLVRSLNRVGSFMELLRGGREARVSMGPLSLQVNVEDLAQAPRSRKSGKTGKGKGQSARGGAGGSAGISGTDNGAAPEIGFVLPGPENTLDLRGLRLTAALARVEEFCDVSVMKYISPVVLIHGHGTGKLKAGVRDWLGASAYVSGFRPGAGGEGWDGVTVVALNL